MALRVGAESKPKLFAAIGLGAIVLLIAIVQIPKFFGNVSAGAGACRAASENGCRARGFVGQCIAECAGQHVNYSVRYSVRGSGSNGISA